MGRRGVRKAGLRVGALVAIVVLVFALLAGIGALTHRTERVHRAFAGPVRSVDVRTSGGSVRVTGAAGPDTTVDAVINRGFLRPSDSQTLAGDRLVIRGGACNPFFTTFCSIDYTIRVPRDVSLKADSSGGDVTISDIHGTVDLSSSGGSVLLRASPLTSSALTPVAATSRPAP